MIVTRGLGRGSYLGALVAFGLTREVVGGVIQPAANGWAPRFRRIKKDPFKTLEELAERLVGKLYEIDIVKEVVQVHKEVVAEPITIPDTVEEVPQATEGYTGLLKLLTEAIATFEALYAKEATSVILRVLEALRAAIDKVKREEEEIIFLMLTELI